MYEYNVTSQMQFEQIRSANQDLSKENEQLKQNLQTLLDYNNKLLAVIEDINNNEAGVTSNDAASNDLVREYENEIEQLREKNAQLEEYVGQLEEEVDKLRQQQQQQQQLPKGRPDQEMTKLVQEIVRASDEKQKRLEERVQKITRDVEDIKLSTNSLSEEFSASFDEKQAKIQELFDHFEKKDEILELMGDKVNILQQYYLAKKEKCGEKAVQTDVVAKTRNSLEGKPPAEDNARIEEKNRVIKIYEELLTKLRKKLSEKAF